MCKHMCVNVHILGCVVVGGKETKKMTVYIHMCERAHGGTCVCVFVCVCARASACVCVCVCIGNRSLPSRSFS